MPQGQSCASRHQPSRWATIAAYSFLDNYNLNNPYPTQQGGANVPGFNALSNGHSELANQSDLKTFRTDTRSATVVERTSTLRP
jgi:hypothetical protein